MRKSLVCCIRVLPGHCEHNLQLSACASRLYAVYGYFENFENVFCLRMYADLFSRAFRSQVIGLLDILEPVDEQEFNEVILAVTLQLSPYSTVSLQLW